MKKRILFTVTTVLLILTLTSCATSLDSKGILDETDIYMNSIKEKYTKTFQNDVIKINAPSVSINTAAGVNVTIRAKNLSDKSVKSIIYHIAFLDRYGETASCKIQHIYKKGLLDSLGPYKKGKLMGGTWNAVIYNSTVEYVVVESVEIEYIDGTTANFEVYPLK